MKSAKQFAQVSKRFYRPEQTHCLVCEKRLRRAVTLTERTVITLEGVIKLVHAGFPNPGLFWSPRLLGFHFGHDANLDHGSTPSRFLCVSSSLLLSPTPLRACMQLL